MSSVLSSTKASDVCSILLNNDYAKSVTVPEAKQHQDGYTIYKIILQAIRIKKTIDENPLSYIAWKRFRDLYKLHRRVVIVHAQLYLKGVVPPFPKPDFFGRREPSVVEERRQASEQFLSFVVQNSVLCQCEAVLAFFSGADYLDSPSEKTSCFVSGFIPSTCPLPLSPAAVVSATHSTLADLRENRLSISELSDISDDLSMHSPTVPERVPDRKATDDSSDLLAAFDPLCSSSTSTVSNNYQLLSEVMSELKVAVSDNGDERLVTATDDKARLDPESHVSSERSVPPLSGKDARSTKSSQSSSVHVEDRKKPTARTPKWRSRIADFFPSLSPSSSKYNMDSSCTDSSPSSGSLKTVRSESHLCDATKPGRRAKASHNQSSRVKGRKGGSPGSSASVGVVRRSSFDYVLQAAEFISSAQKAEEENAFDLAFTCYKSAVMLLLQGVQDEKDLSRRNAVRLKIAKYLKKAEKLYATYIATGANGNLCLDGFTSRFLSNFGVAGFQCVYSELSQFKVLRILGDRVQLVQDITSGEKYSLKFLDKSCYSSAYAATKILDHSVPTRVPHMVKLVKFWDTETAVILLLEFAAGGRLWRRLGSYFERARRMFKRYCDGKLSDDERSNREHRRSGSVDDLTVSQKKRASGFTVGYRSRSGSDPCEQFSNCERTFSLASEPDEGDEDERVVCDKMADTSLFAIYEQHSMRPRYSTEDSFSVDTAPPSAASTRRFSFLYSEAHVGRNITDELEEYLLRKWIAQLTVALGYLHSEGVICRDLHPENILLDDQDNVLLTFFCNWSGVDHPFNHRMANMLYSAPEVDGISNEPLSDAADWWSLGVILYEIATGTPLQRQCPHGIGPSTVIPLPDYLSVELRDLITRLIRYDAEDRLGSCFGGVDEIKMHPFFMEFDWHTVEPS